MRGTLARKNVHVRFRISSILLTIQVKAKALRITYLAMRVYERIWFLIKEEKYIFSLLDSAVFLFTKKSGTNTIGLPSKGKK